jgi:hypothetical protein
LSSAILGFDLGRTTKPNVERALRTLVEALDANAVFETYGGMARALGPQAEAFLARAARRLTPSPLTDRLLAFLRAGPEREQARISPQALAEAWRAQLDDVIHLLLRATDAGLLAVTLDLLCPACQVPRQRLARAVTEVHCEACGIRYDASFPELLAVHFRPSEELRKLDVKIECIGSPGQSRHIVAQETVASGGETDLATELRPGMYRVRTLPAAGPPALLEIADGGGAREVELRLRAMIHPQHARLSSPKRIAFKNESNDRKTAILERLERAPQFVTAGRLLAEFPRFRELVPVLPFFASLELYRAAVLSLTCAGASVDEVKAKLGRAKLAYSADDVILAVYLAPGDLFEDALALGLVDARPELHTFAGASVGMVFEERRADRVVPMGTAVDEAYAAMQGAGFGRLALPARFAEDAIVMRELGLRELSADAHGYPGADGQRLIVLSR